MSEPEAARVRRQIDKIAGLVQAKDIEGLRQVYAPDVVSFDVEPPLRHVGIPAKLANWAAAFATFADLTYELRELAVTAGEDVAFGHAFARLSGTLHDGTVVSGMWVRVTYCLRQVGGAWLIVHDQVSVPLDVRTGRGLVDLEP